MIHPLPTAHVTDVAVIRSRPNVQGWEGVLRVAFVDVVGAPVWHNGDTVNGGDFSGILPCLVDPRIPTFLSLLDNGTWSLIARFRIRRWRFDGGPWQPPGKTW